MKFLSDKKITFVLSLAIAALIAVLVIFFLSNKKVKSTSDIVTHTQNVLQKSDHVLLDILNIETGARGYLLTVNEIFLDPLIKAETTIHTDLSSLTTITQDNPNQQVRIDSLKKLAEERLVLAKKMVAEKRQNRLSELEIINNLEKGKIITDQIKATIAAIKAEEFGLLRNRKIENEKSNKNSNAIFFVLLSFLLAIVALVALIIRNQKIRNNELEAFTSSQNSLSNYTRSLIEASLDPLVTISASGKILDVNESSVKVTGVPREKLIDTDFSNYFTEPKKAQEGYRQVFEKGFVADYPLTIKHKNGNLTDVLYNASVYKDDKGNVLGVFAAARDVTEQKKSSQYARSLIEASLDPLVTISATGKILDVNEASAKVTGVPREKLIDTDFSNYFTEPTKAQEGYRQVFENGFVADYPLTIKHKNGNLTDVLYNASVYKDDKGNVLGVFAAARDITEQKKSSQYARSLIEASLDPLVTISATGKILDVNEASVKVTGVPREKLIDTDFSNYFTEPTKAQEGYRRVFEKGFVEDYPLTIKHKNGHLTDVLYNASVYKDDKGNVLGVFAAARDVTEQKWAKDLRIANKELAFQNDEKEKRAAELIIANKELAFQNEEKEKRAAELIIANKELLIQSGEKEKRATELIIANEELAIQNNEKEKRAAELIIANEELSIQNKEKEKRAAELIIANEELAFQNKEKEDRAAELIIANKELVIESDEKVRRADQLTLANIEIQRNYEEHFSHMADLMPDKITTTNTEGYATFFNQNWIDYTGYTFEELIGFGWTHIMHPDEIPEIQKRWTQSLTTGEDFEMEMQCLSKNDGYKWFLTRAVSIKDANGIIKSWIGTSTEIQRGKEEQQRKDNFIKMVSHELKTPVTSIKGYVQMLLMILGEEHAELFPMQMKNSLLRVDHQVTRLTRLLTEMLDLSRIEAGKLELQLELFSINTLVKDTVDDISLTNPKHTIHLLFDFVCNMYGDKGRIEQVVINLVTNAIKYSANSNKIEVSIRKGEKNMVLVSVRDFGIGIDKADHKKIFDRFFRVEGKMEQTFPGFGIGLFIAKEIIVRHKGYITVESEKSRGSVFTFAFPYSTETNI